jgi:hypothetical protein
MALLSGEVVEKTNAKNGFEDIISAINAGKILDVFERPDQDSYPQYATGKIRLEA